MQFFAFKGKTFCLYQELTDMNSSANDELSVKLTFFCGVQQAENIILSLFTKNNILLSDKFIDGMVEIYRKMF